MTKDDIIKLLSSHDNIMLIMPEEKESSDYDRNIEFIVREKEYRIEWWVNQCYLYVGELQIPFVSVLVSGTWPNGFSKNLQFYDGMAGVVAILPVEECKK